MPDIYDLERGLKISLTDDDYEDYQDGKLSDDFYARRTDGSIANRVDISPWDNDDDIDDDREPSGRIDGVIRVLITAAVAVVVGGTAYGIKKLWDRHKAKKAGAQIVEQDQIDFQKEESAQTAIKPADTVLSTETVNDAERRSLTHEEAIQELMKIIIGMAEIADGKKKVSEGVEVLSNAGIVDRNVLLERLSNPEVLEGFNAYLEKNPQFVLQNYKILSDIFGRSLATDGQYVPLAVSDIERQLKIEISPCQTI